MSLLKSEKLPRWTVRVRDRPVVAQTPPASRSPTPWRRTRRPP